MRINSSISSFLAALIILLSTPYTGNTQFLGYKLINDRDQVRIPFEIYNNLIVVPVKLNGIIPLKFVVDSGVRSSILTDKVITDILQLPYSRKITVSGPGDYMVLEAYVVNEVELHMEGVIGKDQAILVLEEDYLHLKNYLGADVHGLIGHDIFNRFVVEINYSRKILTLYEPEHFKPGRRYTEMPLTVEDTKPYLYANIQINDTSRLKGKLMVDTGASHALMLNANSDENITIPDLFIDTNIGRGLGGPISGKISLIDRIDFNDFEFEDVVASFPDPESYPDSIGLIYRNGTIGGELLSRFTVIFDYFNEKIYFRKNSKYKQDFGYNMSGLTVTARGDDLNKFIISNVRDGSPADEADLRINDQIIYLQGIGAEDFTLNDMYKLFNYRAGKRIIMYVKREEEVIRKKFRLRDILQASN